MKKIKTVKMSLSEKEYKVLKECVKHSLGDCTNWDNDVCIDDVLDVYFALEAQENKRKSHGKRVATKRNKSR